MAQQQKSGNAKGRSNEQTRGQGSEGGSKSGNQTTSKQAPAGKKK
jgi:hypothetical protein